MQNVLSCAFGIFDFKDDIFGRFFAFRPTTDFIFVDLIYLCSRLQFDKR